MNLGQFIDTFKDAIARRVVESYPPLYRPSENGHRLPRLLRKPLGAQADAIRGAALSLEAHRGTTVVGEMGTGKTFIAAAAAHMAGFRRILVLCPPHLVPKWKREVEMTVPGARAVIVKSITDLERLRLSVGSGPLFAVMSREKAKLSYRWMPAVIERWAVSKGRLLRDEETGEPFRVPCCPDCTAQIVDKDGVPLTDEDLNRRKHTCAGCGSPLWQADKSGPARYPLADYVKHHMKGFFDLLVGDEVHEYKGRGSAQGIAAGVLADVCGKSLSLSGTLMGGYSSTLFHLLYRFSPEIRTEFGRSDEHRWIQRYGFEEHTIGKPDDDAVEDGRNSRRRKYRKVVRERPGLVPSALFHIIGNTVFLRLADVASGLPPYEEQVMLSSMDSEEDATGYSQRSAYNTVYEELRLKLAEALKAGSKRLLATYLQTLSAYPDGCTRGETVFDPRSGDVIVQVPPLSEERLYPKEKALIDMVAAERMEGRRVLVYATHTGTRDITGRMDDMLTRHGFRVAVMKADAVAPERREAWVADRVKEGIDVMICHPRLVQTGLDLIDFPTLIWYETDYSVYVMRQASRRSWRIGQTRPVKVVFMSYKNTLQADALKLVAKKLQSSLAVEGELPEDGLAAYGDDGDDLMMALARKIVSGDEEEDETEARSSHRPGTPRPAPRSTWWTTAGSRWRSSRRPSRSTGTATTQTASGRRSSWSWTPATTPTATDTQPSRSTGTATATRSRSRSSRCSPGRSSWPRSRSSRRAGAASLSPQPPPCSIGRSAWSRSGRRSRSARAARPVTRGGGHRCCGDSLPRLSMYAVLFCCPESRATPPPLNRPIRRECDASRRRTSSRRR